MSVRSFKCSHDWLDVYPTEPDDVCPKCRADVPPCKSYASVEALDEFLGAAASGNARRRVVCPQCEFVVTNDVKAGFVCLNGCGKLILQCDCDGTPRFASGNDRMPLGCIGLDGICKHVF